MASGRTLRKLIPFPKTGDGPKLCADDESLATTLDNLNEGHQDFLQAGVVSASDWSFTATINSSTGKLGSEAATGGVAWLPGPVVSGALMRSVTTSAKLENLEATLPASGKYVTVGFELTPSTWGAAATVSIHTGTEKATQAEAEAASPSTSTGKIKVRNLVILNNAGKYEAKAQFDARQWATGGEAAKETSAEGKIGSESVTNSKVRKETLKGDRLAKETITPDRLAVSYAHEELNGVLTEAGGEWFSGGPLINIPTGGAVVLIAGWVSLEKTKGTGPHISIRLFAGETQAVSPRGNEAIQIEALGGVPSPAQAVVFLGPYGLQKSEGTISHSISEASPIIIGAPLAIWLPAGEQRIRYKYGISSGEISAGTVLRSFMRATVV